MFFREKKVTGHSYLQVVENRREDGRSRQRVVATLGRIDELEQSGKLPALLQSGARFCEAVLVLNAHRNGDALTCPSPKRHPACKHGTRRRARPARDAHRSLRDAGQRAAHGSDWCSLFALSRRRRSGWRRGALETWPKGGSAVARSTRRPATRSDDAVLRRGAGSSR
jgi:hypothetical protein